MIIANIVMARGADCLGCYEENKNRPPSMINQWRLCKKHLEKLRRRLHANCPDCYEENRAINPPKKMPLCEKHIRERDHKHEIEVWERRERQLCGYCPDKMEEIWQIKYAHRPCSKHMRRYIEEREKANK
jgi:hypothetical protein